MTDYFSENVKDIDVKMPSTLVGQEEGEEEEGVEEIGTPDARRRRSHRSNSDLLCAIAAQ